MLDVDDYGTYVFEWTEDNNNCARTDTVAITFRDAPSLSNVRYECDSVSEHYRIHFDVSGGDMPSWEATGEVIDGGGWRATLTGTTFTTPWIATGDSVQIVLTDNYDCQPEYLNTRYECPCLTQPGTVILDPIYCEDEQGQAVYQGGSQDGNDDYIFILHDGDANNIGNEIVVNQTGLFQFIAGSMNLNQTYYVTVIAGNGDGQGGVDRSDRCLVQSLGVPITWYEYPVSAIVPSDDEITCEIERILLDGSTSQNNTGAGSLIYDWSTTDGNFEAGSNLNDPMVYIDAPGTYRLRVTHDISGCPHEVTVVIGISQDKPAAEAGLPSELTCDNPTTRLDATGSDFGTGFDFTWTGPGITASNENDLRPVVDQPGTYYVAVINTETKCDQLDSVVVTADFAQPDALIEQIGELTCKSDRVTLDGTGSITKGGVRSYTWSTSRWKYLRFQ